MVERINHFPSPAPDPLLDRQEKADRPLVSRDLIEHLERQFPQLLISFPPTAQPHEIAGWVHTKGGQRSIIEYLRNLLQEQGR